MKKIYEAPAATVITLEAVEKMALLDGHSGDGVSALDSDTPDYSIGTGSGRPK